MSSTWSARPSVAPRCAKGQSYSRKGTRKIIGALTVIRAPFDSSLYHECHVSGLRVLEVRPGLVTRDFTHETTIGDRPPLSRQKTLAERVRRNTHCVRRKFLAAVSFVRAWGAKEFFSFSRSGDEAFEGGSPGRDAGSDAENPRRPLRWPR